MQSEFESIEEELQ